jgi:flavin reductase (DIM6/NTAB) family NADH-FMN oxidoreductase RutF
VTTETQPDLASSLRGAARRFATGVTIFAVSTAKGTHGLTANSFVTLSLHPALVGVSVRRDGWTSRLTRDVRGFGVSVLHNGQAHYAKHYATRDRSGLPQPPLLMSDTPAPAPIVPGCVAYFVCELADIHAIGDHDLIVGAVVSCAAPDAERSPLIFLDGEFQP